MQESGEDLEQDKDPFKPLADTLLAYLHDIIYKPSEASLDIERVPESFGDLARGLLYIGKAITETRILAKELAMGNLNCVLPSPTNEIASSLKMLHSSLKHLTWQTQQVAKGDYNQRVNFMGDFSIAFNNMIEQLERKRKITLDEKNKLETYVNLILVNSPNPILLFDDQGKLAYLSDSYFRYCRNCKRHEVMGKQIQELFAPIVSEQSLDEIRSLYEKAIHEEIMYETVQEIDFGDPEYSGHYEIQITPILNTGAFAGIIVFLFDMTENIQARRSAEYARDLAEQSSRSKSSFLAKMSHEIRTPMNAILGMAELALRDDISTVAEEHIRTIIQAGTTLLSIINDILDFSKIEVGKLEIVPMEYFFSSLANDVINIIKTRVLESRLRFVVNIDCNIPNSLFGDAIRIRQILLNLLSNAVKYTEKGFVSLTVRGEIANEDTINLIAEIADSGIGIKQEEFGQIFEEFTRSDLEKNRGIEGTGLGLAIARSFVVAMGGKIDVRSEYGKGSTFTVLIPQKIREGKKLAVVENPEKKNVLIYERRLIYADSIVRTMDNLGVKYKLVSSAQDFSACLESREYPFVFLASTLFDEVKKKHPDLKSQAKFAAIAEFGEAITEQYISTLTMPIYCIPVTNFLNGISDAFSGSSRRDAAMKFTAPEANVLVVDDIYTNLDVAEGLLEPYKIRVSLCSSGMDALEAIKSTHYDLILMDNMMPEMDGIETLTHIREMGEEDSYLRKVPVVALTADAVFGIRETLLKNGFDDFLSKPIDTSRLNAILERWIPKEKQKDRTEKNRQPADAYEYSAANTIAVNGLDTKEGIVRTGGIAKKYYHILSTFYRDGAERIKRIRSYVETNNILLYTTDIHALKSASAIIGAAKLSIDAAALEDAGKKGDLAFINANNNAFMTDLEELLNGILKVLPAEDQDSSINKELLTAGLLRLKTAICALDSAEMGEAANILQEFTQAAGIGDSVSAILQNKLLGEYEEAAALIETLIRKLDNENLMTEPDATVPQS